MNNIFTFEKHTDTNYYHYFMMDKRISIACRGVKTPHLQSNPLNLATP